MNSWGFLRHNCVTLEAQLLAIFIEVSYQARGLTRPSPSSRWVSPAAAAHSAARACPPARARPIPRARQSRSDPEAAAPPPNPTPRAPVPVHVTGGSFPSLLPLTETPPSPERLRLSIALQQE